MTPKQVSELSDFELNKSIAKALGFQIGHQAGSMMGIADGSAMGRYVDYCNNWNDLMPLVVEYEIDYLTTNKDGKEYDAYPVDTKYKVAFGSNKNLQRALAECLYLVLLEKQKNGI